MTNLSRVVEIQLGTQHHVYVLRTNYNEWLSVSHCYNPNCQVIDLIALIITHILGRQFSLNLPGQEVLHSISGGAVIAN